MEKTIKQINKLDARISSISCVPFKRDGLLHYRYKFVVFSESFKKFAVCDFDSSLISFHDDYLTLKSYRDNSYSQSPVNVLDSYEMFISQYDFNPKRLVKKCKQLCSDELNMISFKDVSCTTFRFL